MAANWELWHVPSRNALADLESEAEALAFVRDLIRQGSKPADLALQFDNSEMNAENLPSGVTSKELARRAGVSGLGQIRRTA